MRALVRSYDRLIAACGALAAALFGATALGITIDVLLRNSGLGSIAWMLEVNEYALFVATFLGAPWVLRHGAHVRVDVVVGSLPAATARAVDRTADIIGMTATAVLLWYAIDVARTSFREGARVIKMIIIPEWWIFAVVALSAILLIAEFTRRIIDKWSGRPARTAGQ
jgi:TRAP-type C4-dicarboxylate transport system permease small subunit